MDVGVGEDGGAHGEQPARDPQLLPVVALPEGSEEPGRLPGAEGKAHRGPARDPGGGLLG